MNKRVKKSSEKAINELARLANNYLVFSKYWHDYHGHALLTKKNHAQDRLEQWLDQNTEPDNREVHKFNRWAVYEKNQTTVGDN